MPISLLSLASMAPASVFEGPGVRGYYVSHFLVMANHQSVFPVNGGVADS